MILEQCQAAQQTIQAVIKKMRKDPDINRIWCNLLENHTNFLLECFCLKRAGLPVKIHNKRLKILNEITSRYNFLK
ncbi:hypothetical protein LCGC14_1909460 [marine sediment metagenome]|uniref:Uncharacterized protein n=1 Tax=marine sediment metagenome TaxID=412755 RepID=A0A0F9I823_9ZZZZ